MSNDFEFMMWRLHSSSGHIKMTRGSLEIYCKYGTLSQRTQWPVVIIGQFNLGISVMAKKNTNLKATVINLQYHFNMYLKIRSFPPCRCEAYRIGFLFWRFQLKITRRVHLAILSYLNN